MFCLSVQVASLESTMEKLSAKLKLRLVSYMIFFSFIKVWLGTWIEWWLYLVNADYLLRTICLTYKSVFLLYIYYALQYCNYSFLSLCSLIWSAIIWENSPSLTDQLSTVAPVLVLLTAPGLFLWNKSSIASSCVSIYHSKSLDVFPSPF